MKKVKIIAAERVYDMEELVNAFVATHQNILDIKFQAVPYGPNQYSSEYAVIIIYEE